ncbi:hypothetical protein [Parerythrobacter jejuensis]|uniref:Uncharacterized protein n=1 Tax=Parerythrobacter jejuensis TaxID=795812 RepID=A0A845AVE1_9SPHN|nr:hypothetical protein [Parerythrobacter jejuensis]MXP32771.1 hypothetical protein [Parerythrobacter jejuensis]
MSAFMILFLIGVGAAGLVLGSIVVTDRKTGSPALAIALLAGFVALTAITIAHEGVWQVVTNHTVNFWGIQVWYDLLFAVGIALFFIAPRARAMGMPLLPWIVFVGLTASIGLLAMVARLFWLERQAQT